MSLIIPLHARCPYDLPAEWHPHLGDNRNDVRPIAGVPCRPLTFSGLAGHLCKPLTLDLLAVLVNGLRRVRVKVLGPGFEEETTGSVFWPTAVVSLDADWLVREVTLW